MAPTNSTQCHCRVWLCTRTVYRHPVHLLDTCPPPSLLILTCGVVMMCMCGHDALCVLLLWFALMYMAQKILGSHIIVVRAYSFAARPLFGPQTPRKQGTSCVSDRVCWCRAGFNTLGSTTVLRTSDVDWRCCLLCVTASAVHSQG